MHAALNIRWTRREDTESVKNYMHKYHSTTRHVNTDASSHHERLFTNSTSRPSITCGSKYAPPSMCAPTPPPPPRRWSMKLSQRTGKTTSQKKRNQRRKCLRSWNQRNRDSSPVNAHLKALDSLHGCMDLLLSVTSGDRRLHGRILLRGATRGRREEGGVSTS